MRYDLKSFVELDCDNIDIISAKSLAYISKSVGLKKPAIAWQFLNIKEVLSEIPEFYIYFKKYRLLPRSCACTILYDDLPLHVDTPPIIAKMNFPVLNTDGWSNRWYFAENCDKLPKKKDPLGFDNVDVSSLIRTDLKLLAEHDDFKSPIILNSLQLHSVEKIKKVEVPRVMITFTFFNDPWELLK